MTAAEIALLRAEIALLRAPTPYKGKAVYAPEAVGKAIAKAVEKAAPRKTW
ncbi:MAG: hypothetical protein INR70_23385 [Parafilimonas terrae]|nr:hypothetical protein [Parafilimonas terrae]